MVIIFATSSQVLLIMEATDTACDMAGGKSDAAALFFIVRFVTPCSMLSTCCIVASRYGSFTDAAAIPDVVTLFERKKKMQDQK